jgi:O-antigen ligase
MQVQTWQAEMMNPVVSVPTTGDATISETMADTPSRSATAYGLAAAAAAALLPTVFSPSVFSTTFTPKLALLVVVAAIGAVPLVRLARSSPVAWAARAAIGFLGVALISALLSSSVDIGFFGLYDWGTGWLFWLGCAGAFALGASLRSDQLNWVMGGVVFAAIVNSLMAFFQIAVQPSGALTLFDGSQADGMLGNPIHLEALLLGTLALIAGRASVGASRKLWWPVVLVVSAALELTLERVALPVLIVIIGAALVAYGVRRAAPFGVLTLIGYAAAYVAGGSGLGNRVASGTATTTYGTRLDIWRLALQSVVDHPLVGIGPGQVVSAIAPHVSATFAARLGVGTLPADSHDILIEVLATTGVLGFVAFVAWIGGAALRARGPFLACAAGMLVVELIEPLNVGITPVALLALGAASVSVAGKPVGLAALRQWRRTPSAAGTAPEAAPRGVTGEAGGGDTVAGRGRFRPSAVITALLVVASLFVGVTMVVGDHYLLTNYQDVLRQPKIATGKDANRLLPYWAESAEAVAESYLWASDFNNSGTTPVKEALAWYATAVERFPASPVLPAQMGALELQLGNRAAARRQYLRALALDPWTFYALEGLGTMAKQADDWRTSLYWYDRALTVAPPANDLANLIRSDEAHLAPS